MGYMTLYIGPSHHFLVLLLFVLSLTPTPFPPSYTSPSSPHNIHTRTICIDQLSLHADTVTSKILPSTLNSSNQEIFSHALSTLHVGIIASPTAVAE